MKKILTFTILLLMLIPGILLADEIYLADGRVLKGKIIRVTPTSVEYDPERNIVFDILPRGQIKKIVYDSGSVVELNENGNINREQTPARRSNRKKNRLHT